MRPLHKNSRQKALERDLAKFKVLVERLTGDGKRAERRRLPTFDLKQAIKEAEALIDEGDPRGRTGGNLGSRPRHRVWLD